MKKLIITSAFSLLACTLIAQSKDTSGYTITVEPIHLDHDTLIWLNPLRDTSQFDEYYEYRNVSEPVCIHGKSYRITTIVEEVSHNCGCNGLQYNSDFYFQKPKKQK